MDRTAVSTDPSTLTALERLRLAVRDRPPLMALDPVEYATGHALFEARSDQRDRLTAWLVERLGTRAATDTRVLSIGCGDGSVDARLATSLAAQGRRVDYVGVEPHGPSGQQFVGRLDAIQGVEASMLGCDFAQARPSGPFDVVLAVHSLYYVADLANTLRRACALLAPGGELVVLHAPCEPLNVLVRLLAPGRRQAFSDEVRDELVALGRVPETTRIDNRLDLTPTGDVDTDRHLLAFCVQAQLPPFLQAAVRAALVEQSLPEPGLVVTHPVDAVVVRSLAT